MGSQCILDTRHLAVLPGFASKGVSSPLIEVISYSFFQMIVQMIVHRVFFKCIVALMVCDDLMWRLIL